MTAYYIVEICYIKTPAGLLLTYRPYNGFFFKFKMVGCVTFLKKDKKQQ